MSTSSSHLVTDLLEAHAAGDEEAMDQLLPVVYHELRLLARHQRHRWQGNRTMDSAALVHEAYLRLVAPAEPKAFNGRSHFMAVAATAMRQVLVNYARDQQALKRGGRQERVSLDEGMRAEGPPELEGARTDRLVALAAALRALEARNPRQARIVECRFFGGMTIADTAEALALSPATVKRGWAMAKAWLHRDLKTRLAD